MQSKDSRALSNSEEEEYDVDKLIDKMMALKARLMEVGRQSTIDIACMILVFYYAFNQFKLIYILNFHFYRASST